jgi:hypothetical protein
MKKTIVLMAAALLAAGASADTKKMLEVKEYNGTSHKYDITEVINITFDGDRMVVNHATDGLREHDIEAIEVMRFATVSGLYEFGLDEGLEVTVSNGILRATYPENTLTLRIFDLNGRAVTTVSAEAELSYNLTDLAQGTYILMVNEKAIKFIR